MKGKNGKKVISFDRNRAAGAWQEMQPIAIDDEARAAGVVAAFRNNRFAVYIKNAVSEGLLMQGPTGQPQPTPVVHLIVVGAGGRAPTYEEAQRIKCELVHDESDMVEIYPARAREVKATQTHYWCLPPGYPLPLGLVPSGAAPEVDADAIPGVVTRAELQFYVVETPQEGQPPIVEVFVDAADAEACYAANGLPAPSGALRMLGNVPHEEEGAAWSPGAVTRRDELVARVTEAGRKMAEEQVAQIDSARMTYGPSSIEDEIADAGDFAHGSLEAEEGDRLEDLMRTGMQRHAMVREAAMTAEQRAAEAAGEQAAADELAAMRARMCQDRATATKPDGDLN